MKIYSVLVAGIFTLISLPFRAEADPLETSVIFPQGCAFVAVDDSFSSDAKITVTAFLDGKRVAREKLRGSGSFCFDLLKKALGKALTLKVQSGKQSCTMTEKFVTPPPNMYTVPEGWLVTLTRGNSSCKPPELLFW